MYDLVKVVSLLVYPLGTSIGLTVLGILLIAFQKQRFGLATMILGVGWLWFWSTPWVADQAVGSLESPWSKSTAEETPAADAIIVLGGAFSSGFGEWPYPDAHDAVDRFWHGARLYHAGRAPIVVLSGAGHPERPGAWSEAESAAIFLSDLGVPASALLLESEARTTRQNAIQVGALLRARGAERALVVTSALHMRRALATMEASGLELVPAATDFRVVKDPPASVRRYMPDVGALARSSAVVHEWIGLIYYRLRGWA